MECIYQLQLYPFDTQECTVNLQVGEYETKIMKIIPKRIEMKSETLLSQFFIEGWKLEFKNKGMCNKVKLCLSSREYLIGKRDEGVHIKIILKRRINNAFSPQATQAGHPELYRSDNN